MTAPLHDGERRLAAQEVRRLVAEQCPQWEDLPLLPLHTSGTEHAIWRLGADLVLRLPLHAGAAAGLGTELAWLPRLGGRLPLTLPRIWHIGAPTPAYGLPWAVMGWTEGTDAAEAVLEGAPQPGWGQALAQTVTALRAVDLAAVPRTQWPVGTRGGPFAERADGLADVAPMVAHAVSSVVVDRIVAEAMAVPDSSGAPVLLHADLIPGNLIVRDGRLAGLLDFGTLTTGLPAWDLTCAWWVLDPPQRAAFRAALAVDDGDWALGRGFALVQAVLASWYYTPRRHPLAALADHALAQLAIDVTGS